MWHTYSNTHLVTLSNMWPHIGTISNMCTHNDSICGIHILKQYLTQFLTHMASICGIHILHQSVATFSNNNQCVYTHCFYMWQSYWKVLK